ncbi:hypothetical protein [Paraconexibacter sp.]|uniref:hypothetical protein n=1 Tax=Paraconexibacter sp. TaxID=2949640 RepID=UPI003564EC94
MSADRKAPEQDHMSFVGIVLLWACTAAVVGVIAVLDQSGPADASSDDVIAAGVVGAVGGAFLGCGWAVFAMIRRTETWRSFGSLTKLLMVCMLPVLIHFWWVPLLILYMWGTSPARDDGSAIADPERHVTYVDEHHHHHVHVHAPRAAPDVPETPRPAYDADAHAVEVDSEIARHSSEPERPRQIPPPPSDS